MDIKPTTPASGAFYVAHAYIGDVIVYTRGGIATAEEALAEAVERRDRRGGTRAEARYVTARQWAAWATSDHTRLVGTVVAVDNVSPAA